MHITELRLSGFKSFVDPVKAPIEPGLTGVVGPNGCGKSNLLEAVRWVMGANSAKSMRATDMDEVIFAGSAGRPSREHAEVTIVLADAAGKGPGALAKADVLEVERRIRRELGSTYRINGKEVRAKDVQLLFADAATGANSPALVRQGQISELIAAKPQNRRRILEDAAGIAGLHARRHEADLKLRAAETNLTRLDEILAEIEAQAQSLKKQARQAERYRGLAQSLRETEALLLHRRWMEARERQAESDAHLREAERAVALAAAEATASERAAKTAREALAPLREEELVAAAVLRRLEGVRVGLERDLADAEAVIARAETEAKRTAEESERLAALKGDGEATLARLSEEKRALDALDGDAAKAALKNAEAEAAKSADKRAKAEAQLEQLAADAAARRARAQALNDAAQAARSRLARVKERKAALDAQINALAPATEHDAKIAAARKKANAAQEANAKAKEHFAQIEAALLKAERADEATWTPYRAAESTARELEAEMRGLEKLTPASTAKFPPVLAAIDAQAGYERALAAALGDDLDAPTHAEAPAHWGGAEIPESTLPEGVSPLSTFVKAPSALAARIAMVGVVSAKDGAALARKLTPGARLVSREGDLWRWDGFVRRADAPQPAAARLEHKNRLAAARAESEAAATKLAEAKTAWEKAKAERNTLEAQIRQLRAEAPKLATAEADAARAVEQLQQQKTRTSERRGDLETQAGALDAELADAFAALEDSQSALNEAPAQGDDTALNAARAETEAARNAAAHASAGVAALTRERGARDARRSAIEAEAKQWQARVESSASRLMALETAAAEIEAHRKAALKAPEKARAALNDLMAQAEAAEKRRAQAADVVAQGETAARQAGEEARAKDQAHAAAREARATAQAHAEAAQTRLTDIATLAQEQTGAAPEALAPAAGALLHSPLGEGPIAEIERRFERLRSERDAAGLVNLRAEEELAEAQERIDTLAREKEDVAQAVAKLRGAITKLNNEGRARLVAAFEEVDRNFTQLFAALFEGGQAALKLTESEDPLESGLEIFAQPPGKRLTHLTLLSGGEQALTATALIFAVFLSNPAPLCVLDEVDAPLDDANVDRFCRLLEEMKKLTTTRFIAITHNPVTMSRMDRLYGVTMPEQGVSQLVSVDLGRAQAMAATA